MNKTDSRRIRKSEHNDNKKIKLVIQKFLTKKSPE